jgi:hypothetical protein
MPIQSALLILIDNIVGIACNAQYYAGLPMEKNRNQIQACSMNLMVVEDSMCWI